MGTLLILTLLTAPCPTRATWPTREWPVNLVQNRETEVKALEDYAFTLTGTDAERKGIRTDSLLIVKGGTIIYEKYARGWTEKNRHISWSVAKSFSTALAGVAVAKGALKVTDSMCDYVTARDELCAITVKDLMEFGSGLHWQEAYENQSYQFSSVIAMLFGEGHQDNTKFVLSHKKDHAPGEQFLYTTGGAALLSEVARQAGLKKGLGDDWFWTEFFWPIGMKSAVFEGDRLGAPGGGSYVFATSRDYARFGYLYLNDGCWEGGRVLPDEWVKSSTTMSKVFEDSAKESTEEANGWMWWLNVKPPKRDSKPWKDVPDDAYSAIGHWGQYVAVVPSLDVVVVRTGDDRDDGVDLGKLIALSLEVAK